MSALAAVAYTGIVLTIALVVSARLHPARSRRARVLYVLVQCAEYVLLIMAAVGIAVAAITGEH